MRITTISDTHLREPKLPGGDILIHAGDLTVNGFRSEVLRALNYLHEQMPLYKEVVIIPGNHDFWAERHPQDFKDACFSAGIVGLINDGITIEGLKIWGSPVTRPHHDWAFNLDEHARKNLWDHIPGNLDILITHSPPYGILDQTKSGPVGCVSLLERVLEVKPQFHVFGHIHESAGSKIEQGINFINCATQVFTWDVKAKTRS